MTSSILRHQTYVTRFFNFEPISPNPNFLLRQWLCFKVRVGIRVKVRARVEVSENMFSAKRIFELVQIH